MIMIFIIVIITIIIFFIIITVIIIVIIKSLMPIQDSRDPMESPKRETEFYYGFPLVVIYKKESESRDMIVKK